MSYQTIHTHFAKMNIVETQQDLLICGYKVFYVHSYSVHG